MDFTIILFYGFRLFQFFIFCGVWIIFISGVFISVRLILSNYLRSATCNVIAFAISSSIIFQLITLYHKSLATQKMILDSGPPINCMMYLFSFKRFLWFVGLFSSHSCSEYYEALQSNIFWQLNVVHVTVALLKDTLILIASMFGGALGEFLQAFISKLHWVLRIPIFIVISLCVLVGFLAFFGYRFDLFYGLIRVDFEKQQITRLPKNASLCNGSKQQPEKRFIEYKKGQIQSLVLVKELYQKAHAYSSSMKSK